MENTPTIPDNELEQRYIRYKDVIKELTIMNDIFMRNVFKKRECVEYVLRIIMKMKDLQILDYTVQKDYKNLQGRSAVLDCVARDDANRQYNMEIQQDSEGASPKRARYHSGLLDMNTLNPGQDFEELPDSYVIFITKDDVQGNGLLIYHANRVIEETGGMFGVIAFYMIGRAINDVTINGIFSAGGDTLFDMYSLAVCMWCLAIPLAAVGTYYFHWPVVVVYACTCIDEVGKVPWVLHHFRKYKWVKDLTR